MIPLYKPYMPQNLPELNEIIHSGALSYGKWGKAFEQKLSEFIGNTNTAVVNSFNSAMLVVLATLGIKSGDEVIASPMSCLASNQPFATVGVKIIWADIDPNTGTLDPNSVEKKITSKTKAIFHNHFCGYPGYINEINSIGKRKGIYIVDDAIEAFGSEYNGQKIGNTGADATVFSFQTVRLPNTIDGGGFAFQSKSLFAKAKRIRDYGINRTIFRDSLGEISKKCDISEPSYGATQNEVNSYIGYLQMEKIAQLINIQRLNAQKWENYFINDRNTFPLIKHSLQNPNYWVFGILSSNKVERILDFRNMGFFASAVHLPNNNYSVFGVKESLPGVEEFHSKFLALPSGWWFNL